MSNSSMARIQLKTPKQEFYFELLYMVALCQNTLFWVIEAVVSRIPIVSYASGLVFPLIYIFLILASGAIEKLRKVDLKLLGIIAFFVLSFLVTYLAYSENVIYINERLTSVIIPCIPFLLLGYYFEASDKFIDDIAKCCCIAIAVTFVYRLIYSAGGDIRNENMYASYSLLPMTMLVINQAFKNKKIYYIIFSIAGFIHALAMGSRGPIIITLSFIVVCIWLHSNMKTAYKIIIGALLIGLAVWFYESEYWNALLLYIQKQLASHGFSTRIINFALNGEITSYTSGRDVILDTVIHKLQERPILGYGIYGEWQFFDTYTHNIYLEILFAFGVVIGGIILAILIGSYIKSLVRTKNTAAFEWLVLWGIFVFIRGFLSGSFFEWQVFFLIGLIIKNCNSNRKKLNIQQENLAI